MMTRRTFSAAAAIFLSACGSGGDGAASAPANGSEASTAPPPPVRTAIAREGETEAPRWDLRPGGEGAVLALLSKPGLTRISLVCPAGQDRLQVHIPGFRPMGSEDRLTVGSRGEAHALVADPRGARPRGGVTGTGPVPENLPALVAGPLSASYGAQTSGPHPVVPPALLRAFVAACQEGAAQARPPSAPPLAGGACLMQDGERLVVPPLRALGTEPFWGARIEGRCVTYSHPDDQKGTRIWTRYNPGSRGGTWAGSLGGKSFELRTRAQPGCSDGMSDKRYPIAVDLQVGGERRTGCAEPR